MEISAESQHETELGKNEFKNENDYNSFQVDHELNNSLMNLTKLEQNDFTNLKF